MILILIINLLENFCDGICRKIRIGNTSIANINQFFRLLALIRESIAEVFISLVESFDLLIVEETLPVIAPALSHWVPSSGAGVTISIFGTGDIILTKAGHVHVHLTEDLLILGFHV